jgi:hypothetical protein
VSDAAASIEPPPPIGDNIKALPLEERLPLEFAAMIAEIEALAARANDMPKEVSSDDDLIKIAAFMTDATVQWKTTNGTREKEKAPHLLATRQVDGFFQPLLQRIERMKAALQARSDRYQAAKAAEAKREREERARIERAEAERVRREAEAAAAAGRLADAMTTLEESRVQEDTARRAEDEVRAKPAEATRVQHAGGLATSKEEWTFEVEDYALIPLDALRAYIPETEIDKAIRRVVQVQKGNTKLPGVRVFQKVSAVFR